MLQSAEDLTLTEVAKSLGILIVLVGIWVFSVVLYARDTRKRRLAVLAHLVRHYYHENYQAILEQVQNVYGDELRASLKPTTPTPVRPGGSGGLDQLGGVEMTGFQHAPRDKDGDNEGDGDGDGGGDGDGDGREAADSVSDLKSRSRDDLGPTVSDPGGARGSRAFSASRLPRPSSFRPRNPSRDDSFRGVMERRSAGSVASGAVDRRSTAASGTRSSTAGAAGARTSRLSTVRSTIFALKSFNSTRTLDESHQRSFKMFEEAMQESLEERKKILQ